MEPYPTPNMVEQDLHELLEAVSFTDRIIDVYKRQVLNIAREPRDYKVTVEFDQAGQKIMYASFAKVKRV